MFAAAISGFTAAADTCAFTGAALLTEAAGLFPTNTKLTKDEPESHVKLIKRDI